MSSGETRSSHRTILGYGFSMGLTMSGGGSEVVFDTVIAGRIASGGPSSTRM